MCPERGHRPRTRGTGHKRRRRRRRLISLFCPDNNSSTPRFVTAGDTAAPPRPPPQHKPQHVAGRGASVSDLARRTRAGRGGGGERAHHSHRARCNRCARSQSCRSDFDSRQTKSGKALPFMFMSSRGVRTPPGGYAAIPSCVTTLHFLSCHFSSWRALKWSCNRFSSCFVFVKKSVWPS